MFLKGKGEKEKIEKRVDNGELGIGRYIAAGDRLAVNISSAGSSSESVSLKSMARITGLFIQRSKLIRKNYYSLFAQNQSEAVRTCKRNHRLDNGLPGA